MNTTDLLAIALRLFALFLLYSAFVMGIQHYQYIQELITLVELCIGLFLCLHADGLSRLIRRLRSAGVP